MTVCLHKNVLS